MKIEDMKVYQNALEIIEDIYNLEFPNDEQYMLRSQFVRAVHSILLNFCEGYPFDKKQRKHFYKLALGSAYESKACCKIYEKRTKKSISKIYDKLDLECALLSGAIRKLEKSDSDSDSDSEKR